MTEPSSSSSTNKEIEKEEVEKEEVKGPKDENSKRHVKKKKKHHHHHEEDIEEAEGEYHHAGSRHGDPSQYHGSVVSDVEHGPKDLTERSKRQSRHGLGDPLKPREGRDLVWKDVNMTLLLNNSKKKRLIGRKKKDDDDEEDSAAQPSEKKILDGVWGEVPSGQVTAVMGPSGSGKTSLLNILAGRAQTSGRISIDADVRLNNYRVDPTDINVRRKIAFVAQDDSLQTTATPREAIKFSARLRLPAVTTDEEIDNLTKHMLEELGLEQCADTLVGGALLKGISGGERKRTSVGVELVSRPTLVFLDEPTSGLDSFNAVQLCNLLGKVAHAGSSVLFTIHQPSSEIFNEFDRLILLNQGRVMYQGPVAEIPQYFSSRGYKCPTNYNPADYIMTVALTKSMKTLDAAGFFPEDTRNIGESFTGKEGVDHKDALGISGSSSALVNGNSSDSSARNNATPGTITQTRLLFDRELHNLVRATHALKARTGMTIMISLLIGCLFYQVAKLEFDDYVVVQTTFGALLLSLMANIFSTALPSLTAFPEERPVFLREYSTNHYTVLSYFVSRLAMELGVSAVQVTVSGILTYFLVGFSGNFGVFWAGIYLMACSSTALGVLVGSSVENATVAIEFLPAVFMPQILFSGFFVPPEYIPDWLAWIRWICPLTYGTRIVVANEFDGRCDDIPGPNYCDSVMDNVQTDPDELWWYFLVLVLLFAFFRLLALIVLKRKAEKFY